MVGLFLVKRICGIGGIRGIERLIPMIPRIPDPFHKSSPDSSGRDASWAVSAGMVGLFLVKRICGIRGIRGIRGLDPSDLTNPTNPFHQKQSNSTGLDD